MHNGDTQRFLWTLAIAATICLMAGVLFGSRLFFWFHAGFIILLLVIGNLFLKGR